jgi:hypothetical protein
MKIIQLILLVFLNLLIFGALNSDLNGYTSMNFPINKRTPFVVGDPDDDFQINDFEFLKDINSGETGRRWYKGKGGDRERFHDGTTLGEFLKILFRSK